MKYEKLNVEAVAIECVEDEHEASRDFVPSFWWNNRRYYLEDFTRTHNSPWCCGDFPEYIHGVESDNYYNPLFIEIIGDEAVNIYKQLAEEVNK